MSVHESLDTNDFTWHMPLPPTARLVSQVSGRINESQSRNVLDTVRASQWYTERMIGFEHFAFAQLLVDNKTLLRPKPLSLHNHGLEIRKCSSRNGRAGSSRVSTKTSIFYNKKRLDRSRRSHEFCKSLPSQTPNLLEFCEGS